MTRDPRIDPRRGDVVSRGGVTRTVLEIIGQYTVLYQPYIGRSNKKCWITTWQDWCRRATVEKTEDVE